MSDDTLDVVATFLNHVDADLARSALEAAGIVSAVSADDVGGMRPHMWMGGVRLLVSRADLDRARVVLETPATSPDAEP